MVEKAIGWIVIVPGKGPPLNFDPVSKMLYWSMRYGGCRPWVFRSRSAAAYAITHSWDQRQADCLTYGWKLRDETDDFHPGNLQIYSVIGEVRD